MATPTEPMHPPPPPPPPVMQRRWAPWAVGFGIWTLVGLFQISREYLILTSRDLPFTVLRSVVPNLADAYLWAAFTPVIFWLARRFSIVSRQWAFATAVHLIAASAIVTAVLFFDFNMIRWIYPDDESPTDFSRFFVSLYHWNLHWYIIVVGIAYVIDYHHRYRDREIHASKLEAQLVTAQLQALKMQLQPHFLFNTLHAISELVHEDPETADRMITRLGDLLRLSIDSAGVQRVSLKQELEFLRAYLEIEQIRFQDRLTVQMEIAPETLDAQVPNLLLQPLVENAIKHGLSHRAAPGEIEVWARRANGNLELEVRDNGEGFSASRGPVREGVGMGNTRSRLRQLYGARYRLELRSGRRGGVAALVVIPFEVGQPATEAKGFLPERS